MIQKNVVPLHPQLRNNMLEIAMILGYGVMVTLQILVLSFLVRVRVSQLHHSGILLKSKIGIWCNGNTTDSGPVIPGSSPGIPTREHLSFRKMLFSYIYLLEIEGGLCILLCSSKEKRVCHGLMHTLLFDFDIIFYLFSASIALIFSFTSFKSSLSFSTLRFISSTRLLPFLLAALRKPRLFS